MAKRKSKEEKTIDYSSEVLKDLTALYDDDGRAVIEYRKLLDSYKKLSKRFDKTISLNDTIGKSVIVNNENLKDTVNYTIETAREKLLYNVAEHRKTKESLAKTLETEKSSTKGLRAQLDLAYQRITQLEKEVEDLKKSTPTVESAFEKREIGGSKIDINMPQYKKFSFKELLENEIKRCELKEAPLFLVKLTIDNFEKIRNDIEEKGNTNNFLKSSVKYISVTLGKNIIVYFSHHNVIYIILTEIAFDEVQQKLEKLTMKRKLGDSSITYSMGCAQFDMDSDDYESINKKCDNANEKASFDNQDGSIVFY
jgi:GGDEF domain-containing protein